MKCPFCDSEFTKIYYNQKYCGWLCKSKAKDKRRKRSYHKEECVYKNFEEETAAVDKWLNEVYKKHTYEAVRQG